jgi:DNA-binding NarL/FixJ family response regulator
MSSLSVLAVEDYEPFRRSMRSTLGKRPELRIVGEVSDGLEAVQKAQQLRPDLILLDVGLPTLNGIEAARQVRELSPKSKILFVSQETSADVVQEALSLGALGHIAKTHAGIELLAAVEAVCQGLRFVSAGLAGHVPAELADRRDPKPLYPNEAFASLPEEGDQFENSYPAACMESPLEMRGTRAWIVVPRLG